MPSPFPGMNPYFEQPGVWRGFHGHFLSQISFALTPLVIPRYFVEYEESLYIDEPPDGRSFAVGDVAVSRGEGGLPAGTASTLAAPTMNPITARVRMGAIKRRHRWLTIRDSQDRSVVTVLEVLSPSNKQGGDDRLQYLGKRLRILRSAAHLVEIDLLRGGRRMPVDDAPESDYRVLVSRRPARPNVQVWQIGLRDPLPPVPIPLRTGEAEVTLELKPLIDAVYDGIGYGYRLYTRPPDPPLSPAEAEWARPFLPAG